MSEAFRRISLSIAILLAGNGAVARGQDPNDQPPPPPQQGPAGQEILTSGPMHESFAQPVVYDPRPGPVVAKQPPGPIREVPPDQRPEGPNVQWIPGYWAWDDGRNDYLWISGVWREVPPGRQWLPGYWNPVDGGFQWVPGAWMPIQDAQAAPADQSQYLPEPPPSQENGPSSPSPAEGAVWSPGTWVWEDTQYAWRPGFWVNPQPNWLWTPARYNWTPNGYLFVDGYWDRPLDDRGQMFAPVYYSQPLYNDPSYSYQPSIGIAASGLMSSLFVRPGSGSYYYGDYYAPNNFSSGIYPAFAYHQTRYGYDPLFAYDNARYGQGNPNWGSQMRESYLYRREHADARPPGTYQQMLQMNNAQSFTTTNSSVISNNIRNVAYAAPIGRIAAASAGRDGGMRFAPVAPAEQQRLIAHAQQVHQFSQERTRSEAAAVQARPPGETPRARPFEIPRSPIASAHPIAASRPAAQPVPAAGLPNRSIPERPAANPFLPGAEPGRPPVGRPEAAIPRPEPARAQPIAPVRMPPAAPARPAFDRTIQARNLQAAQPRPEPHPELQPHPMGAMPHMPGAQPHPIPQAPARPPQFPAQPQMPRPAAPPPQPVMTRPPAQPQPPRPATPTPPPRPPGPERKPR